MRLYIYQGPNEFSFLLKRGERTIKKEIYKVDKEISQDFLNFLDKFLKRIKIEITEIKSFKLRQGKDVGFTARRVVRAIVNALSFAASIRP